MESSRFEPDNLSGTRGLARAQWPWPNRRGEEELQRAIEIDPNSVTSYRLLAELARKEGDPKQPSSGCERLWPTRSVHLPESPMFSAPAGGAPRLRIFSPGSP
jgi:hypothetical protein